MSTTPTITEQTVDVWGGRLTLTVKAPAPAHRCCICIRPPAWRGIRS